MEKGVAHTHGYGTALGGYALIDVDDPKAFEQYQLYHTNNYIHVARITFEPLADLDAALAPTIVGIRAKLKGQSLPVSHGRRGDPRCSCCFLRSSVKAYRAPAYRSVRSCLRRANAAIGVNICDAV